MLKPIVTTCILLAAATAQAEERQYSFQWLGMLQASSHWPGLEWNPNAGIAGRFTGEDIDNDGIIYLTELSSFHPFNNLSTNFVEGCPASGLGVSGITDCKFTNFSYEIGGDLTFGVSFTNSSDGETYSSTIVSAPNYYSFENDVGLGHTNYWSDDTSFTITSVVPEPTSWGMLLGGLGVVVATLRKCKPS